MEKGRPGNRAPSTDQQVWPIGALSEKMYVVLRPESASKQNLEPAPRGSQNRFWEKAVLKRYSKAAAQRQTKNLDPQP